MLGLPPTPPIEVSDVNQSFQGRVDVGSKHLVGFKCVGGGLLNTPQKGSLVHLRTIFVHFRQVPQPHPKVGDPSLSL